MKNLLKIFIVSGLVFVLSSCFIRSTIPGYTGFSEDFDDAKTYSISGRDFDLAAINSYPQKISDYRIDDDAEEYFTLSVKNHPCYFLREISLSKKEYPEDISVFLQPSSKVTWSGEEIQTLISKINGDNLFELANNAAWYVRQTLIYDSDLAEQISKGVCNTLNSEVALAQAKGTCGEYSNLLLSIFRAKGIPARYVNGIAVNYGDIDKSSWHAWVEFYAGDYGWIPADGMTGRVGYEINDITVNDPTQSEQVRKT